MALAYGFGGRYQLNSLINGNYTSVDEKLDFKEDYLETLIMVFTVGWAYALNSIVVSFLSTAVVNEVWLI